MVTLDVGCGDDPHGDINVDVNVGHTLQGGNQKTKGIIINPKKIKNFIRADARFLPFKNNTFQKATAYEVIEHIENPFQMLKEMKRVTTSTIILTCPHRYGPKAKMPFHCSMLNRTWFIKAGQKLNLKVKIKTSYIPYFQIAFLTLIKRPYELKVEMKK